MSCRDELIVWRGDTHRGHRRDVFIVSTVGVNRRREH
jgi:hypothetical protein